MENINLDDIIYEIDRTIINLQRLKTNLTNQRQINNNYNNGTQANTRTRTTLFPEFDIVNSLINLTTDTINSPRTTIRPIRPIRRSSRLFPRGTLPEAPEYYPEFRRTYTTTFRNFDDFQGNLFNLTRRIFDDYEEIHNQNYDNLEDHIVCLSPQEFNDCVETTILSDSQKEKCPICLEEKTNTNMTKIKKCNHLFCENCIKFWLTQRSKKCPVCRILVNEN